MPNADAVPNADEVPNADAVSNVDAVPNADASPSAAAVPPAATEPPSTDKLLALLDTEIAQAQATQTRGGWNTWALLATLGATATLLLDAWEKGFSADPRAVALLFVALSIVADVLMPAVLDLASETAQTHRFRFGSFAGARPSGLLLLALRSALVAAAAWYARALLPTWGVVALLSALLLAALFYALGAIALAFGVPMQRPEFRTTAQRVSTVVLFAWSGVGVAGLLAGLRVVPPGRPLDELRVAALGTVAVQLLMHLFAGRHPSPLVDMLVAIRREAALGDVDLATAWQRTRLALLGTGVVEWLQPLIAELLREHERLHGSERAARDRGQTLHADVERLEAGAAAGVRATPEMLTLLRAKLDKIAPLVADVAAASERVEALSVKIAGRLGMAAGALGTRVAAPEQQARVEAVVEDTIRRKWTLSAEFEHFREATAARIDTLGGEASTQVSDHQG